MVIKLLLIYHTLVHFIPGHLCWSNFIPSKNSVTDPQFKENIKITNMDKSINCSQVIYKEKLYERISNDWLYDDIYSLPNNREIYKRSDVSVVITKPPFQRLSKKARHAYLRTQMWPFPAQALIPFTSGHMKLTCIFVSMCMSGISLLKFLEFMVYPSEDTPTVTLLMVLPMYILCTILVSIELLIAMSTDNFFVNFGTTNMLNRRPRRLKFVKCIYKLVVPLSCVLVFYVANLTFVAAYINDMQDTESNLHVTKQRFCIDKILDDVRPFILMAPLDILIFVSAYLLFKANWLNLRDF